MAIGLGSPRKTIRLVKRDDVIHVEASDGSFDVTEQTNGVSHQKQQSLIIWRVISSVQKSPSCGMERVRIIHPRISERRYQRLCPYTDGAKPTVAGGRRWPFV